REISIRFDIGANVVILSCAMQGEKVVTSSDGVEIRFDIQGEGRPALVFIHGWANNRSIWDAQVSHFSERYKVVNIDLPGYGESGNNRSNWTIASFGEDVATVIKEMNLEQVVLVGFSMGGPVVIETANLVPEQVAGVVLVDIMQDIEMRYPPPVISFVDSVYWDVITNPTNEKLVGAGFYKKNQEASFERVLSMIKDSSRIGWRESFHDIFRWHNEDMAPSLEKCRVPVMAINSDSEPTNVEAFKKYVPSFQARIIPDVGHVVIWDAPEEFNRLLEECIQEFIGN
ncbi:alpha/beta fold hydrolase, partial [Candidatus Zixiibacteriota bacterium]